MDGQRFDALVRLVAVRSSRRSLLRAAASALTAGILRGAPAAAIACRGAGRACSKDAQCCSKLCGRDADNRRRCHCPAGTEICRDVCVDPATGYLADPRNCGGCGVRCQSGVCLAGVCGQALGETCGSGAECGSGFCVDGLCCDRACDGQCETCANRGRCRIMTGAPAAGRAACSGTGACAGACDGGHSACVYPGVNTICDDSTCDAGVQTDYACDGAGTCVAATTDCGLFVCGDDACLSSCTDDGDCVGAAYCSGDVCTGDLPNGQPCDRRGECQSGYCVDGVCCDSGSCPACHACDVESNRGTCAVVADETACGTDRICCGGVCCGPGGVCDGGSCSVTCLAQQEPCLDTDECCPGEFTSCGLDSAFHDIRCCSTLGGPCVVQNVGQSPWGCCSVRVGDPPTFSQVFCGPDDRLGPGTCGGPGALCDDDGACVSGVCCDLRCCATGGGCVDGVCKPGAGAPCTGGEDCASGLCCGGQCADQTDEHCSSCDDACLATEACTGGRCLKRAGEFCRSAAECAPGDCIAGMCCDTCGALCGLASALDSRPCGQNRVCCEGTCCPEHFGCCGGECRWLGDDDHCGACDHVCSGPGNYCLATMTCNCERASVCVPNSNGASLDAVFCAGQTGLCALSTEGELACIDAAATCGQRCTTSADCPSNNVCSDSTCCGKTCTRVLRV